MNMTELEFAAPDDEMGRATRWVHAWARGSQKYHGTLTSRDLSLPSDADRFNRCERRSRLADQRFSACVRAKR
jgi:hypothetical protein